MDSNEVTLEEIYRLLGERDLIIYRLQKEIQRLQQQQSAEIKPFPREVEANEGGA